MTDRNIKRCVSSALNSLKYSGRNETGIVRSHASTARTGRDSFLTHIPALELYINGHIPYLGLQIYPCKLKL